MVFSCFIKTDYAAQVVNELQTGFCTGISRVDGCNMGKWCDGRIDPFLKVMLVESVIDDFCFLFKRSYDFGKQQDIDIFLTALPEHFVFFDVC